MPIIQLQPTLERAQRLPLQAIERVACRMPLRQRAAAHRFAVDMDGARAALGDAAATFGAGQTDLLPDHPQQRGLRIDIDVVGLSINSQASHSLGSSHHLGRSLDLAHTCASATNRDEREAGYEEQDENHPAEGRLIERAVKLPTKPSASGECRQPKEE
jgi:hypothetical protein